MTTQVVPQTHSFEDYLELERGAAYKSELVNGYIYAMAGASRSHNLISGNAYREISQQIRGRSCESYASDMRVLVEETGMATYPDVVAVCGEPRFHDSHVDTLLNPLTVIEVLSPSTEAFDRGEKFAHYRRIPSLQEYVLISQGRVRVECFVRQGEHWVFTEYRSMEAVLDLESIGCRIALNDIYEKVTFAGLTARPDSRIGEDRPPR